MADQYRDNRDDYRRSHDDRHRDDDRGGGIFGRGGLFGSGRDRDRDGTDDRFDTDTRRPVERHRDDDRGGVVGRGGLLGSGRDRDRDGTDDRFDTDTRRPVERVEDRSSGGGIFGRGGLLGSGRDRDRDGVDDRFDTDTRRTSERHDDRGRSDRDRYAQRVGGRDNDTFRNDDERRPVAIDETTRVISSDKVQGTRVYNPRGERLGTIRNLMIEKRSGRVEYAVLSFGGFLGMGERYHPIPWEVLKYDERQDGYVVDIDERQLERGPSFGGGQEPRWDYGYGRHVHDYYGVQY